MDEELELVERVFMKIALADTDENLQSILDKFLIPTLNKFSSPKEAVKNKVFELLNHINKRLKSRPKIQLPTESLIQHYQDVNVESTVKNFSIIYIKMGYHRESVEQKKHLLFPMLSCMPGRVPQHQLIFIQGVLLQLNEYKYPENKEELNALFSFLTNDQVKQFMIEFLQDFILLPYNFGDFVGNEKPPPPSLSKSCFKKLLTDPAFTKEQIEQAKLGILSMVGAQIFDANEAITILIVALGDARHRVSDKAEYLIKRIAGPDIWEDKGVINKLLLLYQGTPPQPQNRGLPADEVRATSSIRLKGKIFPYFLKSKNVADCNPMLCLQIIFDGLFGKEAHAKIRYYTLDLVQHSCINSADKTIAMLAPLYLQALSKVAHNPKEESKLRSKAFNGYPLLSKRSPELFKKDAGFLQKLFTYLEEEQGEVQSVVQDITASILPAYKGLAQANLNFLQALMLTSVEKPEQQLRLASTQLAEVVFPEDNAIAKYVSLLVSADGKDNVREGALRNLRVAKKSTMPKYQDIVDCIHQKLEERKAKTSQNLPFSSKVYENMLSYIHQCSNFHAGITDEKDSLQKSTDYFSNIFNSSGEDISRTSLGRHLDLIFIALNPTTNSSVHMYALASLLQLVASLPHSLSPLLIDKIPVLEEYVTSAKEEVREKTALLLSILVCSQQPPLVIETVNRWTTGLKNSGISYEQQHGFVLCMSATLSRFSLLNQNSCTEQFVQAQRTAVQILNGLLTDSNPSISSVACYALGEIAKYSPLQIPDTHPTQTNKEKIIQELAKLVTGSTQTKVKERGVTALGNICIGEPAITHRKLIVDTLLDLSKIKQPELQFTVGEALSCIAAGHHSLLARNHWSLVRYNTVTGLVSSDDHLSAVVQRVVRECAYHHLTHVRQAATVWLLSIAKFANTHPALAQNISQLQTTFVDLLSDSDEITQEVASKGLSLIYDLVSEDKRQELVSTLVERLMSGKRAKQKMQDDTQIFKPGELGHTPDGSNLSTYKELCSLATSMNRPDLVYRFMSLASHKAMWNSKKGAAFGFLSIASIAGKELQQYFPEIIPKLYRYQYDPNNGVQQAMSNIWNALVPETKKTVDEYSEQIFSDLLTNITNNMWRTRQACCLALNDLVRSCSTEQVVSRLPQLWQFSFKLMDDIKETVRKAATTLAKTISKISIRLCDVSHESRLGGQAVKEVLPVLLQHLSSQVNEVKQLSLETLLKVSKSAGVLLKPHITQFVVALLESLSGLEPEYLNTLSLQLNQNQEAQDKLDTIRLSASKSSPMMEAIDFCCHYVDEDVLPELAPRLCDVLKTGLGLGTKVGCTTMVVKLCIHCKTTLTPCAGKLLGALLNGLNDHNMAMKKAYANAMGHLFQYAKEATIIKLLDKLTKMYFEKEDTSRHFSCAYVLGALCRYSSDTLYNYHDKMLPLVFVAKHPSNNNPKPSVEETNMRELWQEVWNESTSGNSAAIKLYINELYETISPLLTDQSWGLRIKAAKSLTTIAECLGSSLEKTVLENFTKSLFEALQGRTWSGKEEILNALAMVATKCKDSIELNLREKIIDVMLKECHKENFTYKLEAIHSFTIVVEEFKIDKFEEFKSILEKLMNKGNDGDNESASRDQVTCSAIEAIGRLWPHTATSQEKYFDYTTKLFVENLNASTWKTQRSLLQASNCFVERTVWKEALNWTSNGKNSAEIFINTFLQQVFQCYDVTTYSSIKLSSLKLFASLYACAKQERRLHEVLKPFEIRLLEILESCKESTNFDISTNATELNKTIRQF